MSRVPEPSGRTVEPHGFAESRLRRVATMLPGVCLAVYLLADLATVAGQADAFAAWWWTPALAIHVAFAVAFLVIPVVASTHALRVTAAAFALVTVAVVALIVPAVGVGGFPDGPASPWPLRIEVAAAAAAALAWPPLPCAVYILALTSLGAAVRWATMATPDLGIALQDQTASAALSLGIAVAVLALLRASRVLDAAAASAFRAERLDAAAEAREVERRRAELLVHDDVLYVLRAAAWDLPAGSDAVPELAAATLARLESFDDESERAVQPHVLVERLESLGRRLDPRARFRVRGAGEYPIPADVVTALAAATGEALRNSVLHAAAPGTRVRRWIGVRLVDDGLVVEVGDTGRGFDPSAIPATRLGVRRSIVERMAALPGGRASVASRPGRGTVVELRWRA